MTFKHGLVLYLLVIVLTACKTTQQYQEVQYYTLSKTVSITGDVPLLKGTITELTSGEPLFFAGIALYQEGELIAVTEADFDGNYSFELPKINDTTLVALECAYVGMKAVRIEGLSLSPDIITTLDIQVENNGQLSENLCCPLDLGVPLIEQDNTTSGQIFTSEQIRRSGVRSN